MPEYNTIYDINYSMIATIGRQTRMKADELSKELIKLQSSVEAGLNDWQGPDKTAFMNKWNYIGAKGTHFMKLMESMEQYATCLIEISEAYQKLSTDRINVAKKLGQ